MEDQLHGKSAVSFIKTNLTLADNHVSPKSSETANSLDSPMTSWDLT